MIFDKNQIINGSIPSNILGVYYFLDINNNIIYIGKSINIKKRIQQHLKNGRKRMLYSLKKIKIKKLHTELEALLFESQEIKRNKPIFNRRLRRVNNSYSLFMNTDKNIYPYYYIKKTNKFSIMDFHSKRQAKFFLDKLSKRYNLCDKLNGLDTTNKNCFKYRLNACNGACNGDELIDDYKERFIDSLSNIFNLPNNSTISFNDKTFKTYVTINNNRVIKYGVDGFSDYSIDFTSYDEIKIVSTYKKQLTNYNK